MILQNRFTSVTMDRHTFTCASYSSSPYRNNLVKTGGGGAKSWDGFSPEGLGPVSAVHPGHSRPPAVCNTPPRQHCSPEGSSAGSRGLLPGLGRGWAQGRGMGVTEEGQGRGSLRHQSIEHYWQHQTASRNLLPPMLCTKKASLLEEFGGHVGVILLCFL